MASKRGILKGDQQPEGLAAPAVRIERAPKKWRLKLRLLSWLLAITTALTLIAIGIAIFSPTAWERLNSQIAFLLSPFYTLLSLGFGYYFAKKVG